jgi:hypothetical protein
MNTLPIFRSHTKIINRKSSLAGTWQKNEGGCGVDNEIGPPKQLAVVISKPIVA